MSVLWDINNSELEIRVILFEESWKLRYGVLA
jgi:hypothetical protein